MKKQDKQTRNILLTVDVAHPPLPAHRVEEVLDETLRNLRHSSDLRILKIIHGYGSSGAGGQTKTTVLNWIYTNRSRMRRVIRGEEYSLSNADVQEIRVEVGPYEDIDLGNANPGITICLVR